MRADIDHQLPQEINTTTPWPYVMLWFPSTRIVAELTFPWKEGIETAECRGYTGTVNPVVPGCQWGLPEP